MQSSVVQLLYLEVNLLTRIDPLYCKCSDCKFGYSVPLDKADLPTLLMVLEGQIEDSTDGLFIHYLTEKAEKEGEDMNMIAIKIDDYEERVENFSGGDCWE